MFPLVAFALSHGAPDVACAIAFAVCVNVGASLACIAAIKYTVPEDYLPKSLTAWPWEVRGSSPTFSAQSSMTGLCRRPRVV